MSPAPLRPVSLPELRPLPEGRTWRVDQLISGIESLTPVRGSLRARHHGGVLELEAEVETIVTLCCDRCLNRFNHPLRAAVRELLEVAPPPGSHDDQGGAAAAEAGALALALLADEEGFGALEDPGERLDPAGCFDPERWLYEQLSLRLPLVSRCGADCPGPATWSSGGENVDPRWAALQALRQP